MATRNCVVCRMPLPVPCPPARLYCTEACRLEAAPSRKARAKKGADAAAASRAAHDDKPPAERPTSSNSMDANYRPDEWRFIQAIEAERKRLRRRFLTWAEVWSVAARLMRETADNAGERTN